MKTSQNMLQAVPVVVVAAIVALADQVKENQVQIRNSDRDTLDKAILSGTNLGKIKAWFEEQKVKSWQKWCEEHCEITDRTIRSYIRVAKASEEGLLTDCKSLMEAYTVIRQATPKKSKKQQGWAEVTTGTFQDIRSLEDSDTLVKVKVQKKKGVAKGIQEAWSKHSKEIKKGGHLVIYLEISPPPKVAKVTEYPAVIEIGEQVPANISA